MVVYPTKYGLIADELRRRIGTGQCPVGQNLPAESALATEFGVSRMTVRQALDALEQDRVIRRIQGRGTIVVDSRYRRSMSGLRGVFEDLKEAGHRPGAKVVRFERIVPDEDVAHELQLGSGEVAISMTRIRTVDDEPFGIQYTYLPNRWVAGLNSDDLEDVSLYSLLEGRYGLRLKASEQQIGARLATEVEADALGIPRGSPLVTVRRLTVLSTGEPIELMDAGYRAELVTYVSTLQRRSQSLDQRHQPRMAVSEAAETTAP